MSSMACDAMRDDIQLSKPQRVISVELPLTYVQRNNSPKIFWKQGSGSEGEAENDSTRSNTWHLR